MVLFHPAHPEQFSRVKALIDEVIDRPARQIYVEAMVLEITSAGLEQLGIEWEFHEGKFSVEGGSANADIENFANLGKTLFFTGTNTQDLASEWLARIRALLIDGKAEVLSRPSVLALNNRQASVRIGTDIPID
jgi:general secretion pathway protein D